MVTKYMGAHCWNVVYVDGTAKIVDVMHDPGQLFDLESEKAKQYKRLSEPGKYAGPGAQSIPNPKFQMK